VSSTEPKSPSAFKPGKWGKIVPPRLPEEHLALEPRLATLNENAILRFIMFASGRKPAQSDDWKRIWVGKIKFGLAGSVGLILMFGQNFANAIGQLYVGSPIFWIIVTLAMVSIIATAAYHLLNHTRTLFAILEKRLMELRAVPITAEDYALAHWGGYLLLDPYWRKIPATALWTACREMEMRLEKLTGWSYYPSTFGIQFNDDLGRGKIVSEYSGEMILKKQFDITESTFSYTKRLDYLAALWREYLEVWWPNQPGEGEARRATLPSRAQKQPLPSHAG